MRRRNLTKGMAILLIAACMLSGCGSAAEEEEQRPKRKGRFKEAPRETGGARRAEEAENPEHMGNEEQSEDGITPEQMELLKYNYYVELNNDIIDVMDSVGYYYEVVDDTEEFSLLPDTGLTYGYCIYGKNTDILDDCLLLADMEPDFGEMDHMVKEMEEPLRALMETFSAISNNHDYAENQYQKAKEYHAVINANAGALGETGYEFIEAIAEMSIVRTQEEENRLKEEGMLINYYASRAISIGREVLNEASAQGVGDENLNELDLAEIRKLHDELVEVVADFDAATADNDQLIKESLSNSRPFDGLLDGLIDALEWMMKQAESGELPDMSHSGAPLGSMEHFSYVLGQCIDRYNTVFVE